MRFKVVKKWKTKEGFKAICLLNSSGYINGYIGVKKSNKYFGLPYYKDDYSIEEILSLSKKEIKNQKKINNIKVHGGLTFSAKGDKEYLPEGYWWFGFDTAHCDDAPNKELALKEFGMFQGVEPFDYQTFKDLDFVTKECEKLSKQLSE